MMENLKQEIKLFLFVAIIVIPILVIVAFK